MCNNKGQVFSKNKLIFDDDDDCDDKNVIDFSLHNHNNQQD